MSVNTNERCNNPACAGCSKCNKAMWSAGPHQDKNQRTIARMRSHTSIRFSQAAEAFRESPSATRWFQLTQAMALHQFAVSIIDPSKLVEISEHHHHSPVPVMAELEKQARAYFREQGVVS